MGRGGIGWARFPGDNTIIVVIIIVVVIIIIIIIVIFMSIRAILILNNINSGPTYGSSADPVAKQKAIQAKNLDKTQERMKPRLLKNLNMESHPENLSTKMRAFYTMYRH